MTSKYHHINYEERMKIEVFLDHGASPSSIARALNRHRSTISRELQRTRSQGLNRYISQIAQQSYNRARQLNGLARRKFGSNLNSPLWVSVIEQLRFGLSPQQYAGRMAMLDSLYCPSGRHSTLYACHTTIYQALADLPASQARAELTRLLRRSLRGRRRRKPSARHTGLQNTTPLHLRPQHVELRDEIGHWEGDLIRGAANGSAIGTLVERATRLTLLVPLRSAHASDVLEGFKQALGRLPARARRTLTYDRGSEMALHQDLAKALNIKIYFCPPYSPGSRGTNENTNGLLRQYFTKGTDLNAFSAADLAHAQHRLNHRPRRVLGYLTPHERWNSMLAADASSHPSHRPH